MDAQKHLFIYLFFQEVQHLVVQCILIELVSEFDVELEVVYVLDVTCERGISICIIVHL
jgi:hypothetical protein